MEILITWINAGASLVIALALITAILSNHVHDGIVIKIGLGSMALGFLVVAMHTLQITGADVQGLQRALLLINSGIAVVIFGYLFRAHRSGHPLKRITDWADFDTRPMNEEPNS
jgi:hypothetical protein